MKTNDGITLVHCSYHKCVTKYFARIFKGLFNVQRLGIEGYTHFNSLMDEFNLQRSQYKMTSINNHHLDLSQFKGGYRISRFVRDPRDLIVSGYHYHKRSAEDWCDIVDPTQEDWKVVNGNIPSKMEPGESYAQLLNRLSVEEGLKAEIEFRKFHFESMRDWPMDDPNIMLIRYEEMLGNEVEIFERLFDFYQLGFIRKRYGLHLANKFSAKNESKKNSHFAGHIRNPELGQWKKGFTEEVSRYFDDLYSDVLEQYGYE